MQGMINDRSPRDLEVVQLTDESGVPASHVYMEAQIFTPDSRRLVLHRSAHPHGSDPRDPEHRYLLCDLEDGCSLSPLTTEAGATGPAIAPDGAWFYYFVDETWPGASGRFTLKRVRLDGTQRETLLVIDGPPDGADQPITRPYPLSTIRSDGRRIATAVTLGPDCWGLLVVDIPSATARVILSGSTWCNVHPQYCRSTDPEALRDLLVQENHGYRIAPDGKMYVDRSLDPNGADIHVVRDDGNDMRDLPWGRDGVEYCQGHQCWRGRSHAAITSADDRAGDEVVTRLFESDPIPHAGHIGRQAAGRRTELSAGFPRPGFCHFATDIAGDRFITDNAPRVSEPGGGLYLGRLPQGDAPLQDLTYLLNPGSSWAKNAHVHPFLSPDGRTGFFNSDATGTLQAYMVRGW